MADYYDQFVQPDPIYDWNNYINSVTSESGSIPSYLWAADPYNTTLPKPPDAPVPPPIPTIYKTDSPFPAQSANYSDQPAPQPGGSAEIPRQFFAPQQLPESQGGGQGPIQFDPSAAANYFKYFNPFLTSFSAPSGMESYLPPEFASGEDEQLRQSLLQGRLYSMSNPASQVFSNQQLNPYKNLSLPTGFSYNLPNKGEFSNLPLSTSNEELASAAKRATFGGTVQGEAPSTLEKALWGATMALFSIGTGIAGGAAGAAIGGAAAGGAGAATGIGGATAGQLGGGIGAGLLSGATSPALQDKPLRDVLLGAGLGGATGGIGAAGGPLAGAAAGAAAGGGKAALEGGDWSNVLANAGLGALPGLTKASLGGTGFGTMGQNIGAGLTGFAGNILRDQFLPSRQEPNRPPPPPIGFRSGSQPPLPGPMRRPGGPTPSPTPMPSFLQQFVGPQPTMGPPRSRDEEMRRRFEDQAQPPAPPAIAPPQYVDQPGLTQAGIQHGLDIGRYNAIRAQQLLDLLRVG